MRPLLVNALALKEDKSPLATVALAQTLGGAFSGQEREAKQKD